MKILHLTVPVMAAALLAGQAVAQNDDDRRTVADTAQLHDSEAREAELARRLREAEAKMAEAARQIAELTSERLPHIQRLERRIEMVNDGRPRLGVTIGGDEDGPVEGVRIVGVTPGSAASDAGLRAGDIITAVNDESLSAAEVEQANAKLLDFMAAVEEGDTLDIEYLRDGKVGKVEVEPRPVDVNVFAFGGDGRGFRLPAAPDMHIAPGMVDGLKERFLFHWSGGSWGDMELVELNEGLGRYFGTDEGLLVVAAPESSALQLEDGDVIQKIDGRTPTSVRHAMRILASYQAGESLSLEIMRDKKRRTLNVEIPAERSSMLFPGPGPAPSPRPAAVRLAPRPGLPSERT
ncbi:MAG: PDZ domain-containing protein [Gammaproteobacteria bacterium]|nr:PDZ domain-containing protein [Gammaproteobacteria bacterium]